MQPLENIFSTFSKPANDTYGWVATDRTKTIFLNDFTWTSELIPWGIYLLLLEGYTVHLLAPKKKLCH